MIQTTFQALNFIEEWYYAFNIPLIKISQLYPELDKDKETQEILWTKHSIDILLNAIEKVIENKQPITEEQLISQKQLKEPWSTKIRQNSIIH
ncbi:unnamed protein product [Rotaria sp. Silwood2]|nr:unnamed protein product [Rotaria sp. Silwood2]CAF3097083.1 unnamed protein product [Rotaria sp. Silwood2]CAF3329257.1 unnamed protein product [Rotaria sp. Silwood2]CAF3416644.1 unnamed protein product [Rotaria sp. Silwood2]CAF4437819.1 unnamed protein product [Rotaria sp. Silwood2]